MRLDPKKVHFVSPFATLGLFGDAVRFVRGPKTVQLQETALVVEGNVLKVGLLGLEVLFRAALAEWTSVTVPYSRITRVKYTRFPAGRKVTLLVLGLILLGLVGVVFAGVGAGEVAMLAAVGVVMVPPAAYVFFRISPRFVIDFRGRTGRRTRIMLNVTDRALRKAFAAKLEEYRAAAAKHAAQDPLERHGGVSLRMKVGVGVAFLVAAAVLGLVAMYYFGSAVEKYGF